MSGVCLSEMQFVQGRLQGCYRAKRAVNETVPAPFPAAAAWRRPVRAVPPLHLVLAVLLHTVYNTVRINHPTQMKQVLATGDTVKRFMHKKVYSTMQRTWGKALL